MSACCFLTNVSAGCSTVTPSGSDASSWKSTFGCIDASGLRRCQILRRRSSSRHSKTTGRSYRVRRSITGGGCARTASSHSGLGMTPPLTSCSTRGSSGVRILRDVTFGIGTRCTLRSGFGSHGLRRCQNLRAMLVTPRHCGAWSAASL